MQPDAPEIWAYGFREPWRFSFDSVTGNRGRDVRDRVEEVDIVRRGESRLECLRASNRFPIATARKGSLRSTGLAHKRSYGNSVTGGYAHRGKATVVYGVYISAITRRGAFGASPRRTGV
jgi:hypothetical protein